VLKQVEFPGAVAQLNSGLADVKVADLSSHFEL
jgi:hypothetical protein